MDLQEIRAQIDDCDRELLGLFAKRMALTSDVARYKKEHDLPVFQEGREMQVLQKVEALTPEGLQGASRVLFTNMMDISKYLQQQDLAQDVRVTAAVAPEDGAGLPIACQGVSGAYSEAACRHLFAEPHILFRPSFEDVFHAVEEGEAVYGILPIQNSRAGSVSQNYGLLAKRNVRIYRSVRVRIEHCLAARPGVRLEELSAVYSHEQALRQCAGFFAEHPHLRPVEYSNTAAAAQLVSESAEPLAAICSPECAKLYGLAILREELAGTENFTRFICIRRDDGLIARNADTITVSLAISNAPSSLYRLLTKFAVAGLDLTRIESVPFPEGGSVTALFYLDFTGSILDAPVARLLSSLGEELPFFRLLGNYPEDGR